MGVHGWQTWLCQNGYLRDNRSGPCCSTQVFCSLADNSYLSDNVAQGLESIPSKSTFHIDGNGLVFHLQRIAYARWIRVVVPPTSSRPIPCNVKINKLKPYQARALIPTQMDQQILASVTKEFFAALGRSEIKVVVYWDGEARRNFKRGTDEKRDDQKSVEWDNLKHYCETGMLMTHCKTLCKWEYEYPRPPFSSTQVKHTLSKLTHIKQKECEEEADYAIAAAATGKPNHYVLGNDTDFAFFRGIQYTPFETINVSDNSLTGVVIRRHDLAESIGLADDDMVDLCVLLGNDYISPSDLDLEFKSINAAVDYIKNRRNSGNENGNTTDGNNSDDEASDTDNDNDSGEHSSDAGDEVRARLIEALSRGKDEGTKQCLDFVQSWYELRDVRRFPLYPKGLDDTEAVYGVVTDDKSHNYSEDEDDSAGDKIVTASNNDLEDSAPKIPDDFCFEDITLHNNKDPSVRQVVARCLNEYLNKSSTKTNSRNTVTLTKQHIAALNLMKIKRPASSAIVIGNWRPRWEDVGAAYFIEAVTRHVYGQFMDSALCRAHSPFETFDQSSFHAQLASKEEKEPGTQQVKKQKKKQEKKQEKKEGKQQESSDKKKIKKNGHVKSTVLQGLMPSQVNGHGTKKVTTYGNSNGNTNSGTNSTHNSNSNGKTYGDSNDNVPATSPSPPPPDDGGKLVLPVDEHEKIIMDSIRHNRVTIIQGETGCGKSSRIPIMLLRNPPPEPDFLESKIFVSQPRRIAVCSLVDRIRSVEEDYRDKVALRMGHGERKYETNSTRAWFVTTGYLVRYMANNMEKFGGITHIVIDEVHERSVDTDVLCLICRRLLQVNKRIRLVLMSATLAAALYQDYFEIPTPPIKVGVKRFPVKEQYLDDLDDALSLPSNYVKIANDLISIPERTKGRVDPTAYYLEKLLTLASYVSIRIGRPGSSVLVFVSGMSEILTMYDIIEKMSQPGVNIKKFSIHSEVPLEDQMTVFNPPAADEVRIIIATNAAESSVTLPEVNNVIDLGLCKQITYNEASHRPMLSSTWISKASATQRAGRTGRIRPGTVYRLYSRRFFENQFDQFEHGEILRIPLDNVILNLKDKLPEESVTGVLEDCIEPPGIATIDSSFRNLYKWHFVTSPDDDCHITDVGHFALALGTDIMLASLIGLGVQTGVGPEAIMLAAVLSFPKSPWIVGSPLIHDPAAFNDIISTTIASKYKFDGGIMSDPFCTMNMLWDYMHLPGNSFAWCKKNGIASTKVNQLEKTYNSILQRIEKFCKLGSESLKLEIAPKDMPKAKCTILRIILTWTFHESIITCQYGKLLSNIDNETGRISYPLCSSSSVIEQAHLDQVFGKECPARLVSYVEKEYKGIVGTMQDNPAELLDTIIENGFEQRLFSFCYTSDLDYCWYIHGDCLSVFTSSTSVSNMIHDRVCKQSQTIQDERHLYATQAIGGQRGRAERATGMWSFVERDNNTADDAYTRLCKIITFTSGEQGTKSKKKKQNDRSSVQSVHDSLQNLAQNCIYSCLSCKLSVAKTVTFNIRVRGKPLFVSTVTLQDIFASTSVVLTASNKDTSQQSKQTISFSLQEDDSNEKDSLFRSIPIGARLLTSLASNYKNHSLKFKALLANEKNGQKKKNDKAAKGAKNKSTKDDDKDDDNENEDEDFEVFPSQATSSLRNRWKRFESDKNVVVANNSLAASVLPISKQELTDTMIFAIPALSLELKDSKIKVDQLTILPEGDMFLMLCRMTFNLVNQPSSLPLLAKTRYEDALNMVKENLNITDKSNEDIWQDKIQAADKFCNAAQYLGEDLVCHPDIVKKLLRVFEGVVPDLEPWPTLATNPFCKIQDIEEASDDHWSCHSNAIRRHWPYGKSRLARHFLVYFIRGAIAAAVNSVHKER